MLEDALRQSLIISEGSSLIFFTRPISGALMGLAVLLLTSSMFVTIRKKREALPMEKEWGPQTPKE
jgi:TctA family transporter